MRYIVLNTDKKLHAKDLERTLYLTCTSFYKVKCRPCNVSIMTGSSVQDGLLNVGLLVTNRKSYAKDRMVDIKFNLVLFRRSIGDLVNLRVCLYHCLLVQDRPIKCIVDYIVEVV